MRRECFLVASALLWGCAAAPLPPPPEVHSAVVPAPSARAEAEDEDAVGPPLRDAERVIARLRPRFRLCYERGLQERREMAGDMLLVTRVRSDGSVRSARAENVKGLTPRVAECIAGQMRGASFTPPGAASTIKVPVHFVSSIARPPR
jgi:hypothetical protein